MSEPSGNPFVLPGMGQQSDLSGNPLLASMEMMRQAWAGLAGPGGLAQSLPMTPPSNIEDLERRIADLRAVESWLRLNLSMLGSTIQGMEVQRATIATLRSFVDSMSSAGSAPAPGEPSPLEVVLGLRPAAKDPEAAASEAAQPGAGPETASSSNTAYNSAAQSASKMWWDLLQQQFNGIASAAAASMSGMPAGQAPEPAAAPAASTPAAAGKKATAAPAAPAARKKPARKRAAAPAASTAGKS